ncbi:hypothetical protein ASG17_01345 [Brevundimonas sp. Leaf363]|uniref:hypothetical protein n=1 Tax=Brevundimonas sp. Leaf363 TaxID=1736353 RepID=UPI0006FD8814|nr:hypothetical protein [Brevundimonas sp. Leaf363]KQS57400.1 hypothetical protein ASG17_01345 [Brevundimonas sp. Leaf363]
MFKGLLRKAVAGAIVAASAFMAVVFLGVAIYSALALIWPPLGAAAATFGLFAVVSVVTALVFLGGSGGSHHDDDEEEEAPQGLAARVIHMVRERPIVGVAGGLGALFLLLRNPALAAIVASMVTERKMEQRGYRRRR